MNDHDVRHSDAPGGMPKQGHLEADHETLLRLLGYLSPAIAEQLKASAQVEVMPMNRPGCCSSAFHGGAQ